MTTTRDIRELIAEQAESPAERRPLEATAERLEDALTQEVPYRPEFKAELRRKLMAQARRQAPKKSIFARPVVWGSAMGMAAAVGILAVGLSLWNTPEVQHPQGPPPKQVTDVGPGTDTEVKPVSTFPEIPRDALPDEQLPAGHPGAESLAGVNVKQGLTVYKLTGDPPGQALFNRIAQGLSFTAPPEAGSDGWTVNQGLRALRMGTDGRVVYTDKGLDAAEGRPVDSAGAAAAAERFLLQALLPINGQPTVMEGNPGGKKMYRVTYTWRVEGRPVVNQLMAVSVSERGTVTEADGYVRFVENTLGKATEVFSPEEGLRQARERGGSFGAVDLVYVRTRAASGDYYLQPYWRAFGTGVVRYVPALK